MINTRSSEDNRSRSVDDPKVQDRIGAVVSKLVQPDE